MKSSCELAVLLELRATMEVAQGAAVDICMHAALHLACCTAGPRAVVVDEGCWNWRLMESQTRKSPQVQVRCCGTLSKVVYCSRQAWLRCNLFALRNRRSCPTQEPTDDDISDCKSVMARATCCLKINRKPKSQAVTVWFRSVAKR